jgi:hypothetical protein
MGSQAQGQQPSQVYYDADMGQYYTQNTQTTPNGYMPYMFNMMSGNPKGNRNYLNSMMNQSSPALQQAAPYEYADVSLESLFPSMNQGGGNSALAGLLGGSAPSATGSASSGAGRFM